MENSSQPMSRRATLSTLAGAAALTVAPLRSVLAGPDSRQRMGLAEYSYQLRQRKENQNTRFPRFANALQALEHLHGLNAGGGQFSVGRGADLAKQIRSLCEKHGMYFESQTTLPKDETDLERFEAEIKAAKEAGASVVRSIFIVTRRYETFDTLDAFRAFKERSWKSLQLADPVVRRNGMKLAIENHKDLRATELLAILDKLQSECVGVCIDTGNNMALLETVESTVETLAKYIFSAHFKDMSIEEHADGFLLSEVPLGEGILNLPRVLELCRSKNTNVRFNLEMITRDPLKIPCRTEKYWATFEDLPRSAMDEMLALLRKKQTKLPRVAQLPMEEQLAAEEANIVKCFGYAREKLGL